MTGCSVVTQGEGLEVPKDAKILKLGDGLEMAGYSVVKLVGVCYDQH